MAGHAAAIGQDRRTPEVQQEIAHRMRRSRSVRNSLIRSRRNVKKGVAATELGPGTVAPVEEQRTRRRRRLRSPCPVRGDRRATASTSLDYDVFNYDLR